MDARRYPVSLLARALAGLSVLSICVGGAWAVDMSSYLPLATGNQWTYQVSGGTSSVTVGAPVSINGNSAYPLNHSDGNIIYYTNDANGLRIHGQYAPNGLYFSNLGYVSYTVYYTPPIRLAPASVEFGYSVTFSGTARATVSGGLGTYTLSYSGSGQLPFAEDISAPYGTYSTAKLAYNYTVSGNAAGYQVNVPISATDWLAEHVGVLQETAVGSTGSVTASLQSTNVVNSADCLFNWAESHYSAFFAPAGAASLTAAPYYFRYYSSTNTYLGISSTDNHVYYVGGGGVQDLGPKSALFGAAGCPQ